jgi:hypothetical protein
MVHSDLRRTVGLAADAADLGFGHTVGLAQRRHSIADST